MNIVRELMKELKHKSWKTMTLDEWMVAVKENGFVLAGVKDQTPEICMAAINQNAASIYFVENQTLELCMAAVQKCGFALGHIKTRTRTPEICLAAVKQHGLALQFVKNQTPEICLAAVKQNKKALIFIEDPILRKKIKRELHPWRITKWLKGE